MWIDEETRNEKEEEEEENETTARVEWNKTTAGKVEAKAKPSNVDPICEP